MSLSIAIKKAQQNKFERLNHKLSSTPVLMLNDPNKELKMSADVYSYDMGVILLQESEEDMHPRH